jgi:hypothetical protein
MEKILKFNITPIMLYTTSTKVYLDKLKFRFL